MKRAFGIALAASLATLLAAAPALAQVYEPYVPEEQVTPVETEPELLMPWGMAFSVGGGLMGFTDSDTLDLTDNLGGAWDARFVLGTREILGFEAGYNGFANGVDAPGIDNSAVLLSTGLEGLARLNILRVQAFQPYIIAGLGWRHYDLTNEDFNFSSVRDDGDVMEVPMGAGIAYRLGRFLLDLRGAWRPAVVGDDMLSGTDTGTGLSNWEGRLNLGWEF